MKNQIVYKITNLTDKEGNYKEHLEDMDTLYFIYYAYIGHSARLVHIDEDKHLRTSTVEDIRLHDNNISIFTRNSIYTLAPVTL